MKKLKGVTRKEKNVVSKWMCKCKKEKND